MRERVELTRDEVRLIMGALFAYGDNLSEGRSGYTEGDFDAAADLHDQLASLGFSRFEGHREGLRVTLEVVDG